MATQHEIHAVITEPVHNILRFGAEDALRVHRVAAATITYTRAGALYTDTLVPLSPMQVYQSSPASYTFDVTAQPWVSFIFPQNGGVATMYVTPQATLATLMATLDTIPLDLFYVDIVEPYQPGVVVTG